MQGGARGAKAAKERADLADRVRRIDSKPKGLKGEAKEAHGAATSFLASALPPPTSGNARLNVINELRKLRERGVDPLEDTHVIEIDNCATSDGFASTVMRGCSPCITRRRAQCGGHWVSTRGRRLSTAEMLRLQGMRPARCVVPPSVPTPAFHGMVGNSMSVNIVEVLLAMLSRACPGVLGSPLRDRWSAT